MAQTTFFQVKSFQFLGNYEIHFGKNAQGYLYEIQDMENSAIVDSKDNLTFEQFFDAVECAMTPSEKTAFQELVHSLV